MLWLIELIAVALLTAGPLLIQANYHLLPERVPVHFNFRGVPDAWGPRGSIWLLPVVGGVLYLITTAAGYSAPPGVHLGCALLKAETLGLFLVIERSTLKVAVGKSERLDGAVWWILGAVLLTAWGMALLGK